MSLLFTLLISIFIQTQKDFDDLLGRIYDAYEAGESRIEIELDSTVFFFRENHLSFIGREMPGLSIDICGNGAVLVAEEGDTSYDVGKGFVDLQSLRDVDTAKEIKRARFWPLRVPFRKGIYRLPVDEPDMSEEEAKDVSIVLSQWFHGKIYKVIKISRGKMIFRRDDRNKPGMYAELRYGRCLPRYIICRPPEHKDLHCCSASNFLKINNGSLGSISFRNVRFLGNSSGDALFDFKSSELDSIVFEKCTFEGIRSDVITLNDTDNLRFHNNLMTRCYRSGIRGNETSDNCSITGNSFIDNGRLMVNNCTVKLQGSNLLIRNNLFEDFSYIAIGVGTHYSSRICETSGLITENELRLSESFRSGVPRMLIDGGAIYCWTQNKDVVISNNYIHDISGPHGNRGILADDGSINLTICGNRVMNVSPSYCIDIRKAKRVAWRRKSKIKKVNVGNKIYDNVYDGRVRIYVDGSDSTSTCYNNVKI